MALIDTEGETDIVGDKNIDLELIEFLNKHDLNYMKNALANEAITLEHLKEIDITDKNDLNELCNVSKLTISQKIKFKSAIKQLQCDDDQDNDHKDNQPIAIEYVEQKNIEYQSFEPFEPLIPDQEEMIMTRAVIVGPANAGKSCILKRLSENKYECQEVTTCPTSNWMRVNIGKDTKAGIVITDTPGQERLRSIIKACLRGMWAIIIVYDITDRKSFEEAKQILCHEVFEYAIGYNKILFVGNKCDLEQNRKVSFKEGSKYATKNGASFAEISAKTAEDMNTFKEWITSQAKHKANEMNCDERVISLEKRLLSKEKKTKKSKCCT